VIPQSDIIIKDIEKCFRNFLWNGKKGNIKQSTLILDYKEGGLKMVDLHSFITSLRLSWVKMLRTTEGIIQIILGPENINFIFELDKKSIEHFSKTIHNPFWKQILQDWAKLQENPRYTVLWRNQNAMANKKPVFYRTLYNIGITRAEHLLNPTRTSFITFRELEEKNPEINITFIQFHGLIPAIPKEWKEQNIGKAPEKNNQIFKKQLRQKNSRYVYALLDKRKGTTPESNQDKWEAYLNIRLIWEHIYRIQLKTTKNQKLKLLQYKIIHRRVATNQFLEKNKSKPNALCTFCKTETETTEHLFYSCKHSRSILMFIKNSVNQNTLLNFPYYEAAILLCHNIESLAIFYFLKYFVHRCILCDCAPGFIPISPTTSYHFANSPFHLHPFPLPQFCLLPISLCYYPELDFQ
jgi:hypothetical protein